MSLIDVRVLDRLTPDIDQPTRDQLAEARIAARARIEAAELELRDGVGFADVARKYSDGLAAQEGGSWGWVTPGSVRKRFEPAVEKLYELDEGAVSDILEVDDGFFLVRCDEIDPGVEPDFQSVQPQLREQLIRIRYNRLIAERVNELRAVARIEPEDLGPFHDAVVAAAPSPESPP
jgi:parvulin-like peptidyl-prolyl isomerase